MCKSCVDWGCLQFTQNSLVVGLALRHGVTCFVFIWVHPPVKLCEIPCLPPITMISLTSSPRYRIRMHLFLRNTKLSSSFCWFPSHHDQLGKVQARRLALSADNRTILLSSSKLTSRIKSMKKLFKSTTSGDGDAAGGSPGTSGGEMGAFGVRKVDVGLLDYVQRGQHTSKFRLAR